MSAATSSSDLPHAPAHSKDHYNAITRLECYNTPRASACARATKLLGHERAARVRKGPQCSQRHLSHMHYAYDTRSSRGPTALGRVRVLPPRRHSGTTHAFCFCGCPARVWQGRAAERTRLSGAVRFDAFDSMAHGGGGEQLLIKPTIIVINIIIITDTGGQCYKCCKH